VNQLVIDARLKMLSGGAGFWFPSLHMNLRPPRNRHIPGLIALLLLSGFVGFAAPTTTPTPRVENFNRDWKFAKGAQDGAEAVAYKDADWESVRLPHDWAISGPYEPQGDPHTGKLPWRGEGWYRKSFTLPAADAGKRVYLDFDGVMAMPTSLCERPKSRRLGLRLHVLPRGCDGFREARANKRRGGARRYARTQLALVSRRGHLPQSAAGDQ
jgi:hypothetical protein